LLGRPGSFAIVSHVNHGREFKRIGLEYDLIKLPLYTVEQMAELVKRRIEWVRREPEKPVPTVTENTITGLLIKYGDDVAVNDHLYELFEQLTGIHHV